MSIGKETCEGRITCQEPISGTLMQEPFSVPDTFFFPPASKTVATRFSSDALFYFRSLKTERVAIGPSS